VSAAPDQGEERAAIVKQLGHARTAPVGKPLGKRSKSDRAVLGMRLRTRGLSSSNPNRVGEMMALAQGLLEDEVGIAPHPAQSEMILKLHFVKLPREQPGRSTT